MATPGLLNIPSTLDRKKFCTKKLYFCQQIIQKWKETRTKNTASYAGFLFIGVKRIGWKAIRRIVW